MSTWGWFFRFLLCACKARLGALTYDCWIWRRREWKTIYLSKSTMRVLVGLFVPILTIGVEERGTFDAQLVSQVVHFRLGRCVALSEINDRHTVLFSHSLFLCLSVPPHPSSSFACSLSFHQSKTNSHNNTSSRLLLASSAPSSSEASEDEERKKRKKNSMAKMMMTTLMRGENEKKDGVFGGISIQFSRSTLYYILPCSLPFWLPCVSLLLFLCLSRRAQSSVVGSHCFCC